LADLGAYEFTKSSEYAYIATLHSSVPNEKINEIEALFSQSGKIYYKKEIDLSFEGYVNLKKLSYQGNKWIGSQSNNYEGATKHAEKSFGSNPLRVYVLIYDDIEILNKTKNSVRDICGIGNFSIHITDNREESISLARYLLNNSSISFWSNVDTNFNFDKPENHISKFKSLLNKNGSNTENFCIVGSYSLSLFGIRQARDLDYIFIDNSCSISSTEIDNHGHEDELYFGKTINQILDPRCYFYLYGIKFINLPSLLIYKSRRNEYPKDTNDIGYILDHINSSINNFATKAKIEPYYNFSRGILVLLKKIYAFFRKLTSN